VTASSFGEDGSASENHVSVDSSSLRRLKSWLDEPLWPALEQPKSRSRRTGALWLQQFSLGNGPELVVQLQDRLRKFRVILVLFSIAWVAFVTSLGIAHDLPQLDQVILFVSIVGVGFSTVIGLSALSETYERVNRERLARTRIAMFVTTYPFRNELMMLTIVNGGEMTIVGDVVLALGWIQTRFRDGPINFVILGYSNIVWLHQQIEGGEVIRVPERFVREAFKDLLERLDSERMSIAKKYDASLIAFVTDVAGFNPEKEGKSGPEERRSLKPNSVPNRNMLSACDLGIDFGLATRFDLTKPFDVHQMRLTTGLKKAGIGLAEMQFRIPPQLSTRETLLEILEQLRKKPRHHGRATKA
jgi:hypothetical protein